MARDLISLLLVPVLTVTGTAFAQDTGGGDPTRPPAAFVSPQASVIGSERLRSIKIPSSGKPSAVIDGQVVRLGDKVGDAVLVRLTATQAVLKGPAGEETLQLTPDVSKTMLAPQNKNLLRKKEKS